MIYRTLINRSMRLFTAIDIGAMDRLVKVEKELEQTGANLKMVEPSSIHCTLKFLGDVDKHRIDAICASMERAVTDVASFTMTVKGMGVFPSLDYIKVVWVGLDGGPITTIAEQLEKELSQRGFKKEKRPFTPHSTLARVKSAQAKEQLLKVVRQHQNTHFGDKLINAICLKKSDLQPGGPVYTTLREIPL